MIWNVHTFIFPTASKSGALAAPVVSISEHASERMADETIEKLKELDKIIPYGYSLRVIKSRKN